MKSVNYIKVFFLVENKIMIPKIERGDQPVIKGK